MSNVPKFYYNNKGVEYLMNTIGKVFALGQIDVKNDLNSVGTILVQMVSNSKPSGLWVPVFGDDNELLVDLPVNLTYAPPLVLLARSHL